LETLLRYRGAAMAEFWRALRTLKALQAEQALDTGPALAAHRKAPAARPALVHRPQPDEPKRGAEPRLELCVEDVSGVVHDPLRDRFRLSRDPAVNYMLFATRG
jgi:hypothetical protein